MNLYVRLFALLLTVPLVASARLGETEAQLVARFGEPVMRSMHNIIAQGKIIPLGPRLYFREGDWSIDRDLVDSRCLRISYHKPGDWTEEQIRTVLSANDQGSQWVEQSKSQIAKLQRNWRRTDSSTAEWGKGTGMTLTWVAYLTAKAKAEERARIESSRQPKI